MVRCAHRIVLLFVLLIGGAGMNYVEAANAQIIVKTTPSGYGTVKAGNSSYQATVTVSAVVGGKLTLYAKPNTGYKFVKWEDNSTAATRTVTVPNAKTTTYTATFAVATYTLTVTSNNTNYGTVTGGGTYNHGASATLTATPKTGYHFVQWSDGNTNATRTISNITANATYTATFAINTYTLTVSSNNTNYGTVTGGGTYNHGATANLKATPKTGYHFVQWNDGNTNASRSVTVTAAKTYTATFAINQYTLTVKTATNNTTQGTVRINSGTAGASASATINHGVAATITATPATGYHFVKWNDNNTTASRSVTVTAAATYTATFAINTYTIKFVNGSTTLQTSTVNHGVTPTYSGSTPTKSATAQYTYTFSGWSPTIAAATKDQTYTAQFSSTVRSYKITGASANTNMGTVSGTATKQYGQTVTLTATPKDCFKFVQWNDGNTTNPRTVTVQGTATYTATFEEALSGTCGTDVRWYLNECTGVLRIEGTGAMTNFASFSSAPWYNNRTSISSVTIASGVTSIGNYSFYGCSNLSSVTIPASVTAIGNYAFYNCWAMESLYITDLAAWCSISRNDQSCSPFYRNVNSSYLGGGNLYVNNTKVTTLTIPNGVTAISNYAFVGFAGITSIQFNKATTIGAFAFAGCHGLTNVTIPNGVTTAGNNSFAYCTHLQSMSIPASVTSLGNLMLYNCQALTDIHVNWTGTVPTWQSNFTSKSPQSSITLHVPCGAGEAYYAASGWKNYTITGSGTSSYTLTVQSGNSVMGTVQIDTDAAGTTVSKSVHCEDSHTITAIPTVSSTNCSYFSQWSDGNTDNPRSIGISANKTFVAQFEEGVGEGTCGDNVTWYLSCDGVLTISGTGAMTNFSSTTVPWAALRESVKSVVIENGITTIGNYAFYGCSLLKDITIPNSVTSIAYYAFYGCASLTSVTIPNGVTGIGSYAFYSCSSLTSVTIPNTVTSIGGNAFYYCSSLQSVTIPNSVTSISSDAFGGTTTLRDIYVSWTTAEAIPVWNSMTITDNQSKTILHIPCGKTDMYLAKSGWQNYAIQTDCAATYTLTVASNDGDLGSVQLNSDAPASNVTQTVHSGDVHYIRAIPSSFCYTFLQWSDGNTDNPRQVSISSNASYTAQFIPVKGGTCGDHLTWNLSCDGELTISGTGDMYDYSSTTIPWYPEKDDIQSVRIGNGVTRIGNYAFYSCSALSSVTMSNSVTAIGSYAFAYCAKIPSIIIGDHVTTIGKNAFYGCRMKTITIPSSVTSIGLEAFYTYYSEAPHLITDIYVPWTTADAIPEWNSMTSTLSYPQYATTLHIPCGSGDLYRAKDGWKDYVMKTNCSQSYTLTVHIADPEMGMVQIDEGTPGTSVSQKVYADETHHIRAIPIDGCHSFSQWNDGITASGRNVGITANATYTATLEKTNEKLGSGSCGPSATYVISCDSVLTISGTGAINNNAFSSYYEIKSVVINEGITRIGTRAFANCKNMEYITFPSTLINLGYGGTPGSTSDGHVFYCCYKLKSIYIPANVKEIGIWPLLRCNDLETIVVDPDNKYYDSRQNCNAIIETRTNKMIAGCMHTTMPHTTEIIDRWCFEYLHKLKSMLVASSVHTFTGNTFKECENLKDIYVEWTGAIPAWNDLTTWYEHQYDNLDAGITIHVPCGHKTRYESTYGWNKYNIVDDHLKGGMCGMYGSNQTWMLSCDSILTIRGNGKMEDFVLTAGGTNAEWSDHREAVKTIVITDGVGSIGENAFRGFINLKDIYVYAAENIPDMPASNNPNASVTLHVPCTAIKDYQEADGWKDYTIVTEYTGSGACGINGDNLTWTLCNGELTISGTGAMKNWNSADELPWAAYTDAIQTITIADDVTTIGSNAFRNCTAVTTIELPDHITAIGDDAFAGCGGLKTVTIPVGVTTIGESAFASCNTLTDIYVMWQENIPAWQNMTTNSGITLHIPCSTEELYSAANGWKDYTIVNEMLVSGTCGAEGDNLTWALCDSTLYISGTGAMKEWLNTNYAPWYSYQKIITSVIIEDGVSSIGSKAFLNCSKLTSLTIPPSVTSISNFAFYNCSMLESLYISDLAAWCNINFEGISSSPFYSNGAYGSGKVNLYVNGTKVTALTIPDGVTTISNYAFLSFAGITDIQFNQVTTIGSYAFCSCHGLTNVTIPEGVTTIHNNSFNGCSQLQSMSIPASAVSVENEMMFNCEGLTDIYVHWTENIPAYPSSFTTTSPQSDITLHVPCGTESLYQAATGWKNYQIIEDYLNGGMCGAQGSNVTWALTCDGTLTIQGTGAMADYTDTDAPWYSHSSDITSVIIGEGITTIGNYAFYQFNSLSSVTVPSTLTSIGSHAFHNCGVLLSITIPDGVATIGDEAFMFCSNLTSITIPNSVTTLGNNVFRFCNNISNIYVSWETEVPAWHNLTSKSPQSGITLHVPCSAIDLYNSASGWKNYTMVGDEVFTITVTTNDASMGSVAITVP